MGHQNIEKFKSRVIDNTLLVGAILGTLIVFSIIYATKMDLTSMDAITDLSALMVIYGIYAFRKHISLKIKAMVVILILFNFVMTDLVTFGVFSFDKTLMVIIPVFAFLVFSLEITLLIIGLMTISYFAVAVMFVEGYLELGALSVKNLSYQQWIESYLLIAIVCAVISLFFVKYDATLRNLISELEANNDELKAKQEELKRTNQKNQSIISFLSHDFRGPLTSLKGYLNIIRSPSIKTTEKETRPVLDMLNLSLTSSMNLLDNLLHWSNKDNFEFKPVLSEFRLADQIKSYVDSMQEELAHKELTCELNLAFKGEILSDITMIEIIIRNLLTNAVKFTHRKGSISVSLNSDGNDVSLIVKDSGIGLTKDRIKELMKEDNQNSSRGTENEKGTGIGLQIVKRYISALNGKMEIRSEGHEGTEVALTFKDQIHQVQPA